MTVAIPQLLTAGFEWKNRRRWIWASSIFCMVVIMYCLFVGSDARIYETAMSSAFVLLGSIGGSYVFAAAWEHKQIATNATRIEEAK